MTHEAQQAREEETQRRRHLETCKKPVDKCGTCFKNMIHEMMLIQCGKGNRLSDKQVYQSKEGGK
jgi:hypothetical protein